MSVAPLEQQAMDLIRSWPHKADTMAFRWGGSVLIASTALSALAINRRFRFALRLRDHVPAMSLLGVCVFPCVCALPVHRYIANKPLLSRTNPCPICIDMRSAITQNFMAVAYPLTLAPIVNFAFASTLKTDGIPTFHQPKELFLKFWNIVSHKKFSRKLALLGMGNFAVGWAISAWERRDYYTIMSKASEQGIVADIRKEKLSYDLVPDRY